MTEQEYQVFYGEGRADQWAGSVRRRDFGLLRKRVDGMPDSRSVLDVGCGTGDFLVSLPAYLDRYGIEPSAEAGSIAESRGIAVLGADLTGLSAELRFDVVTAIDVFEHLVRPSVFLDVAWRHVRAGGMILISTGDPQCRAWRLLGSRFWYVNFPEHLVFPSERFFEIWAARRGARYDCTRFRYFAARASAVAAGITMQAVFAISPSAFSLAGRLIALSCHRSARCRRHYSPGIPGVFLDHQVIALHKDS